MPGYDNATVVLLDPVPCAPNANEAPQHLGLSFIDTQQQILYIFITD